MCANLGDDKFVLVVLWETGRLAGLTRSETSDVGYSLIGTFVSMFGHVLESTDLMKNIVQTISPVCSLAVKLH